MQKCKNKIEIITYFNNHHRILYDLYFKPTFDLFLDSNFKLITHYTNESSSANIEDYGYTKKIWQKMIVDRFDIIIDHISSSLDPDKISIFSDVDIIFFGNFYDELQPFINNRLLTLWYMPEFINAQKCDINGGFFAFKHTQKSIDYFLKIKQMLFNHEGVKNDQPLIQELLRVERPGYVDIMPYSVFNANNCHINHNISLFHNGSLKVFHATSTSSVYTKILVLDRFSQFIIRPILYQQNIIK